MKARDVDRNKATYLWCTCFAIVLIASGVIAANALFGLTLPDAVIRTCGVIDLVAIPVMTYALWRGTRRNRF